MRRNLICIVAAMMAASVVVAQRCSIQGWVIDQQTRMPITYAHIRVEGLALGAVTDSVGHFTVDSLEAGIYRLQLSAIGYKTLLSPQYMVNHITPAVRLTMEESATALTEVTVSTPAFVRPDEHPVGLHVIGMQEIEKAPGANRDISRVMQNYPGVAFSPIGYRNDLIIRGGGPAENRFYLDGIGIPNINHFSTPGATGGPVGLIDADLIRSVQFYSSDFPIDKGNALSAVLDFRLREGNPLRNSVKATVGASELAVTSMGHLGRRTTYVAAVRQSYLQLLFKILALPLLPNYTDASFKIRTQIAANHELEVLGLGGIDRMRLNEDIHTESARYILGYLPEINQETFTIGAVYHYYTPNSVTEVVGSHHYFANHELKYKDNDASCADHLRLRLHSHEQMTTLKVTYTRTMNRWRMRGGTEVAGTGYATELTQRTPDDTVAAIPYRTHLGMLHYALYVSGHYASDNEALHATVGLRADGTNYNRSMRKPWHQLAPRVTLAYRWTPLLQMAVHTGIYYQLPPNTALSYSTDGVQRTNGTLRYMGAWKSSVGLQWTPTPAVEVDVEAFAKRYWHMPVCVRHEVPLACMGNDYGSIGAEPLRDDGKGRSAGIEVLLRWMMVQRFHLSASFTWYRTTFRTASDTKEVPSAWDNRWIANMSGTYNFSHHWSMGLHVAAIGGAPYTPCDVERSSLIVAWDATGKPQPDYALYNSRRLPGYYRVDVRVDKMFYWKRWMLGLYLDIQNITASRLRQPDIWVSTGVVSDESPMHYVMRPIENVSGTVLPTVGITMQF